MTNNTSILCTACRKKLIEGIEAAASLPPPEEEKELLALYEQALLEVLRLFPNKALGTLSKSMKAHSLGKKSHLDFVKGEARNRVVRIIRKSHGESLEL